MVRVRLERDLVAAMDQAIGEAGETRTDFIDEAVRAHLKKSRRGPQPQ